MKKNETLTKWSFVIIIAGVAAANAIAACGYNVVSTTYAPMPPCQQGAATPPMPNGFACVRYVVTTQDAGHHCYYSNDTEWGCEGSSDTIRFNEDVGNCSNTAPGSCVSPWIPLYSNQPKTGVKQSWPCG